MWKILRGLLSLESRFAHSLVSSVNKFNEQLRTLEKRIVDATKQLDALESKISARLSRLEVLLSEELTAKEIARDALVKTKRLEGRH